MAMLVYGPSKTAKIQFVLSVQETSAIGFLANWFCSQDEIDQIKANNAIKDTDEITDAGLVNIDTAAQDPETPDIEIVDVKGATYSGKLMIVKDPSRLFVGTVPEFTNGNGMVVADIAKRLSMANPDSLNPLEEETVILIDELDLHLHPKWQKEIVADLKRTFPNSQFIVSTHSPFIVQSLDADELFDIKIMQYAEEEGNYRGWSIEAIQEHKMGVEPKTAIFNQHLDCLLYTSDAADD